MLAWSLSFLCSIFTLRNLGRRREQRGCTPLPKLQLQNAARDLFASREMGNCPQSPADGQGHPSPGLSSPLPSLPHSCGSWRTPHLLVNGL